MRIAISNIAWDVADDEAIALLLKKYDVDAIDIAPGKYFSDPAKATERGIKNIKDWWASRGIEITGMQALLFGTTGLNVFGSEESRSALLAHLSAVCRIGAGLQAPRIVFGSPKNRDRSGLSDDDAHARAVDFFRAVGDIAGSYGVTVCLEPNPSHYGANFMTTSAETARVVKAVSHPAIKMQLDTGAMAINKESVSSILQKFAGFVGHVHASEPDLLPLGDGSASHLAIAAELFHYLPNHVVCIEMVATKNEPHTVSVERALDVASRTYQINGSGVTT